MPRVPKEWLDSVVYVYGTANDARAGARSGGTGFVAAVSVTAEDLPPGLAHLYAVTNHHVVAGLPTVALRINLKAGGYDVLTVPADRWIEHPEGDDLVIASLAQLSDDTHRYVAVNREMMLTPELQAEWDFGAGDEVFFIGRYVDLEGKAHNVPAVRSGIIAARLSDPIRQPHRGHHQETILVEARSLSGFSGSPVFVTPGRTIERGNDPGVPVVRLVERAPVFLLGVDWGHHHWTELVREPVTNKPVAAGHYVRSNSGMMMVIPAEKLVTLLDDRRMKDLRREREDAHRRWIASHPQSDDGGRTSDGQPTHNSP